MSLIDDIRKDREAGTPDEFWQGRMSDHLRRLDPHIGHDRADFERVMNIPKTEAALLAAEELAKSHERALAWLRTYGAEVHKEAKILAAYRKATKGASE